MEVNVVDELVFAVVFQGELNVIAFVDDNHRPRHGVVEGKRPHEHARLDFDFFLVNGHLDLYHARLGRMLKAVLRHGGRRHEYLLDVFQFVQTFGLHADLVAFKAAGMRCAFCGEAGRGSDDH